MLLRSYFIDLRNCHVVCVVCVVCVDSGVDGGGGGGDVDDDGEVHSAGQTTKVRTGHNERASSLSWYRQQLIR